MSWGYPSTERERRRRATNEELRAETRRHGRQRRQFPLRSSSEGWVYFVQPFNGGPIKIGSAASVVDRLETFRNYTPYPLRLLAVCSGGRYTELSLHHELRDWRLHGEWFDEGAPFLRALLKIVESDRPVDDWLNTAEVSA